MENEFKIDVSTENSKSKITLSGEVDLFSINEFKKTALICLHNCSQLEIDLSGVTYMDSSGISSLVTISKLYSKELKPVCLVGASQSIKQLFNLIGFETLIKTFHADNIVK